MAVLDNAYPVLYNACQFLPQTFQLFHQLLNHYNHHHRVHQYPNFMLSVLFFSIESFSLVDLAERIDLNNWNICVPNFWNRIIPLTLNFVFQIIETTFTVQLEERFFLKGLNHRLAIR